VKDRGDKYPDTYQARRLREVWGGATVYLVTVTGYGHEDFRLRARAPDYNHHLVKRAPARSARARRSYNATDAGGPSAASSPDPPRLPLHFPGDVRGPAVGPGE
jgi:hypothetical protein